MPPAPASKPERLAVALAFAGAAAALLILCWPGVVMYDAVVQYRQALSGQVDDWHPPVMARVWALLIHIHRGQGTLLLIQVALTWIGLGLIADGLVRAGRRGAAVAVLLIGLCPLFAAWQIDVVKDMQMVAALVCATGIACRWPPARSRPAAILVLILLAYATLLRANAAFATVPLGFGLFDWPGMKNWAARGAAALGLCGLCLAVLPFINHSILAAKPSGVERALLAYDISGINARRSSGDRALWARARAESCVTPFYWDPLGSRCAFVTDALYDRFPGRALTAKWAETIASAPGAYLAHRIAHWNSTMRWLVPPDWLSSAPGTPERNTLGLAAPGPPAARLRDACLTLSRTPLGWPILWFVGAVAALLVSGGQGLSGSLALSALGLQASFLVVSIASDLRYHLWPMVATALAWTLIIPTRRQIRLTLLACLVILIPGMIARSIWPSAVINEPASLMPVRGG